MTAQPGAEEKQGFSYFLKRDGVVIITITRTVESTCCRGDSLLRGRVYLLSRVARRRYPSNTFGGLEVLRRQTRPPVPFAPTIPRPVRPPFSHPVFALLRASPWLAAPGRNGGCRRAVADHRDAHGTNGREEASTILRSRARSTEYGERNGPRAPLQYRTELFCHDSGVAWRGTTRCEGGQFAACSCRHCPIASSGDPARPNRTTAIRPSLDMALTIACGLPRRVRAPGLS